MNIVSYGNVLIKQQPFESETCQQLITALDAEVDLLYPDAADFPYQGPGEWLRTPQDGNKDADMEQTDIIWQNEEPADMIDAEGKGELVFFVAFLLRDTAEKNGLDVEEGCHADIGEAIGCIGIRVLPWFPYHRTPPPPSPPLFEANDSERGNSSTTSSLTTDHNNNGPPTAEVKRMYVVKEQRRHRNLAENGTSVAATLLQHAESFAKQEMKMKRLVLETGMRQYAAMKLYRRSGWIRRSEFGDYVGAGEDVGGLSRCWEKWL